MMSDISISNDTALAARLHHIALGSPDPEALAAFHEQAMGLALRQTQSGILGEAAGRRTYFVTGEAKSLVFAAFAVDNVANLQGLAERLDRHNWAYDRTGHDSDFFVAGAISLIDPDGNQFVFGVAPPNEEPSSSDLPARLQHVVLASTDAARLSDFFETVLGFKLSDRVIDEHFTIKTTFLRCSEEHHSFAVFQASSNRLDHHCYEAGDWAYIRDWGDHFASHDIKIEWGPGRHGPGNNLFLFIHDIDGNWLEISAELELVKPDRPVGEWPHAQKTLNLWGTAPLRT